MASAFDTALAGAVPAFMGVFGETITLESQVSGAKSILAIVRRESRQAVGANSAELEHEEMQIEVKTSFTDAVAYTAKEFGFEGNTGDVYTIDGETWYLAAIDGRKAYAGMYWLTLKSKQIPYGAELG